MDGWKKVKRGKEGHTKNRQNGGCLGGEKGEKVEERGKGEKRKHINVLEIPIERRIGGNLRTGEKREGRT